MSGRRTSTPAAESLTTDDLTTLSAALADGRRATVYVREAVPSLGLDAGSSARVVSISGTTVTVRPRGIDDELPYEADELRITKASPPKPEPAKKTSRRKTPAASAATAAPAPAPQRKTPAPQPRPAAKRTPKRAAQALTLTIHGTADNEWSVAVTRGTKKPPRSRPVTPESVDAAVGSLGDAAAHDAVTSLLSAAREEAKRRVDELSRELEAAKQALAALENP